jgi:hypothetical protein
VRSRDGPALRDASILPLPAKAASSHAPGHARPQSLAPPPLPHPPAGPDGRDPRGGSLAPLGPALAPPLSTSAPETLVSGMLTASATCSSGASPLGAATPLASAATRREAVSWCWCIAARSTGSGGTHRSRSTALDGTRSTAALCTTARATAICVWLCPPPCPAGGGGAGGWATPALGEGSFTARGRATAFGLLPWRRRFGEVAAVIAGTRVDTSCGAARSAGELVLAALVRLTTTRGSEDARGDEEDATAASGASAALVAVHGSTRARGVVTSCFTRAAAGGCAGCGGGHSGALGRAATSRCFQGVKGRV